MEEYEKDEFLKRGEYREASEEARRIMREFGVKISNELTGSCAKEWLMLLELLVNTDKSPGSILTLLGELKGKVIGNTFIFSMDYDRSVENGIHAGRYDFVHPELFSRFPSTRIGMGRVRVELLRFRLPFSLEGALREVEERGGRIPEFREFLALGEVFPEELREFTVAAPMHLNERDGSVVLVPGPGRSLTFWTDMNWSDSCRFPMVCG